MINTLKKPEFLAAGAALTTAIGIVGCSQIQQPANIARPSEVIHQTDPVQGNGYHTAYIDGTRVDDVTARAHESNIISAQRVWLCNKGNLIVDTTILRASRSNGHKINYKNNWSRKITVKSELCSDGQITKNDFGSPYDAIFKVHPQLLPTA